MKLIDSFAWLFIILIGLFVYIQWPIKNVRIGKFKKIFLLLTSFIVFCGLCFATCKTLSNLSSKFLINLYIGSFIIYTLLSLFITCFSLMGNRIKNTNLFLRDYLLGFSLLFFFEYLVVTAITIQPNNLLIADLGFILLMSGIYSGATYCLRF